MNEQRNKAMHRQGLSLVEVLVASMLLSILALGAMSTVAAVNISRSKINDRAKIREIAYATLAEVVQAKYLEPDEPDGSIGLDAGEAAPRVNFDDVDDFHNFDASPPVDFSGTPYSNFTGWRQQITIGWVQPNSLLTATSDTGLKKITVTITDPAGKQFVVKALRAKQGATEQLPTHDGQIVTWAGVQLQIGENSPTTVSATNLINHADDESGGEEPEEEMLGL